MIVCTMYISTFFSFCFYLFSIMKSILFCFVFLNSAGLTVSWGLCNFSFSYKNLILNIQLLRGIKLQGIGDWVLMVEMSFKGPCKGVFLVNFEFNFVKEDGNFRKGRGLYF